MKLLHHKRKKLSGGVILGHSSKDVNLM